MDKEMRSEETNKYPEKSLSISAEEEKRELAPKLFMANKDLAKTKSARKRRHLQEYIDGLKMDLGWALLDCKEYEKGLAVYESVFGKQYQERKYNGVARALTEMGRYDRAKRTLEIGLRKFPESYALWTGLGILNDYLGDYSGAFKSFNTALRFNYGENSGCLYNKALILIEMGSYGDAVSIIDDLIERFPEEPKYLAEKGRCSLDMGYPHEALQSFQKAMELYEKFPNVDTGVSIFAGFCCAYMELGMKKEAMEIALEGLRRFPDEDPILYQNVGATFWGMGWRQETIEVLKKGIEKFPDDEELKKFLKDAEDDTDEPGGGMKPPVLGLMLLMAILQKRFRKR